MTVETDSQEGGVIFLGSVSHTLVEMKLMVEFFNFICFLSSF